MHQPPPHWGDGTNPQQNGFIPPLECKMAKKGLEGWFLSPFWGWFHSHDQEDLHNLSLPAP